MSDKAVPVTADTLYASSQLQVSSGSLVWDIERFLLFNTPGKSYSSPEFKAGETKWKLNVFAAGELGTQNEANFLGLYLHSMNDKHLMCKYSVTLFIGDQKIEEISDCDDFGKNDNWGWGQLCPLEVLQTIMQDCATLRIMCELEVFVKRQNVNSNGRPLSETCVIPPICTSSSVTSHYEQMLESAPFSDVTFKCKDEIIPAHKAILSVRSVVFKKMFSSGMTETKGGVVTIEECDVAIFKLLLRFLYTGTMKQEVLTNNVQDLFAVADKYDVEDLKALCEKFLYSQLSPQNAASILLLADTYHSLVLKQQVLSLAVANFEEVITSADFADLCKSNPALVAELNLARAELMKEKRPAKKKKTA